MNINDLKTLNTWEATGLLEGLEDDAKLKVSGLFDELQDILESRNEHSYYPDRFQVLLFPTIRRVYNIIKNNTLNFSATKIANADVARLEASFIVKNFCFLYENILSTYRNYFEELGLHEIDIEAEACAEVSDLIARKFILKCNIDARNN